MKHTKPYTGIILSLLLATIAINIYGFTYRLKHLPEVQPQPPTWAAQALTATSPGNAAIPNYTSSGKIPHWQDATVMQQPNGLFIFVKALPTMPYDSLGEVTPAAPMPGNHIVLMTPATIMQNFCTNAKKIFPHADGLVFNDYSLTRAKVIRFK